MTAESLQQFLNANPALAIVGLFLIGVIAVLAIRILLANAHCLIQLGCSIVMIAVILVLLRLLLVH